MDNNSYIGLIWDDVCDMVDEAEAVKENALAKIDAKLKRQEEEIAYWGGDLMIQVYLIKVRELKQEKEAVLDEFDEVVTFASKIEDVIERTLINNFCY